MKNPLLSIYARFFNSHNAKSYPKPSRGETIWDSAAKGTYVRAKHGEIGYKRKQALLSRLNTVQ